MTDWNYADVWETVADVQPQAPAIVQGTRTMLWEEFDRGAQEIEGAGVLGMYQVYSQNHDEVPGS